MPRNFRSWRAARDGIIAAMESLSDPVPEERAERLGRVKFVALPFDPAPATLGPALRGEETLAGPRAGARPFRLLQLLRRIAFRVDGRPKAARP
ncbi:MAG TPA: hypothetical protein VFJ86_11415 [Usitatibacter sp.]|nr:hypothetical protein [Usitatibacter sp.]